MSCLKLGETRLRKHDTEMQSEILDWIVDQKDDIRGATGEI